MIHTQSNEMSIEPLKALGEWALAAGRFFQSEQTGYVHLYGEEADPKAQTIPLLKNALFALALLRSRFVEQVQEAKRMLKSLLAFQNLQFTDSAYGNFPVYLHEYPTCRDPAIGLHLLAPFYWMIKQFGHVLGADLKHAIEEAAHLAIEQSLRAHAAHPFPYFLLVRLAAAQWAYGLLWEHKEWQQEGEGKLKQLAQTQLEGWSSTKHLGHVLVGLQMVYPSLKNSLWQPLWRHMEQTWHFATGCYIGPCIREWQKGEEPKVNLYDLYASYFARQFSKRASVLQPHHLEGILIQPTLDQFEHVSQWMCEGTIQQQAWIVKGSSQWAYTLLEKKSSDHLIKDKTWTPFRLIWGDADQTHSLVCQGGNYDSVQYRLKGQSIQLVFDLKPVSLPENGHLSREIEFFVDFHPDSAFCLNGRTTTTFELGQPLTVSCGSQPVEIVFDLLEGEGNFLGHIMRGNRPSQTDNKGEKRFQAYDWTFFLRTIRRQSPCRLQATLFFPIHLK